MCTLQLRTLALLATAARGDDFPTYVAAFAAFTETRQVSVSGGCQPMWRKDGKELFYRTLEGKLMVVEVQGGAALQTGVPLLLFQTPGRVNPIQSEYCVTGDGKLLVEAGNTSNVEMSLCIPHDLGRGVYPFSVLGVINGSLLISSHMIEVTESGSRPPT